MEIILANPRGFCAGVERAIEIVERSLKIHGAPVYVRHEVVHNKFVVNNLKSKGVIFVEEIQQVPKGGVVIFSAHGVSKAVHKQAKDIGAIIYDATCPLVTKVHKEIVRKQKQDYSIVLIGHKEHPEIEGTMGQTSPDKVIKIVENLEDVKNLELDNENISYSTQTTLSVKDTKVIIEALKKKFPKIQSPKKEDICYATQNRQNAVEETIKEADLMLVIGSNNSSNSNRLREIADKKNIPAYLIDDFNQIKSSWLKNVNKIGITAGASAPETLVKDVINYLKGKGVNKIKEIKSTEENVHFPLPKELQNK